MNVMDSMSLMMRHTAVCVAALVSAMLGVGLAAPAPPAENDDWVQFRGPGARGVVEDQNLPETWSTTENVAWAAEVPGRGWSSPIVVGDSIILTSVVGYREVPHVTMSKSFRTGCAFLG